MELGSKGILRDAGGEPMLEYTLRGAVIRLQTHKKQRNNVYRFGEPEQNICRVCLSMDSYAFYHILDCGLQNDFHNITGIRISPDDGLPHLICCICHKLLRKAAAFRKKSISAQNILSTGRVTINDRNTVTTPLICFTQTETLLISIPPASPTEDIETITIDLDESIKKEEDVDFECKDKVIDSEKYEKAEANEHLFDDRAQTDTLLISIPPATPTEDIETITIDLEDESTETEENVDQECKDKFIYSETYEKAEANEHSFDDHDDFDMEYEVTSDANNDSDKNVVKVKDVNITKSLDKAKPKTEVKTVRRIYFPEMFKIERRERLCKKYNMEIKNFSLGEQIAEVKNRADTEKYKNSRYKCDKCFRGFQCQRAYSYHMKCHDPTISGNAKCEVCNKMYVNRRKLMKHQIDHKFRFICKECGRVCRNLKPASRVNHIRVKHSSLPCEICYELLTPAGLTMHNVLRHKDTFKCECCDKKFNDADALAVHSSDSTNGVCSERPCAKCGEGFSTESAWSAHVEDHRREAKRHEKVKKARYHYSKIRKLISATTGRPEPAMCEMCGRTFSTEAAMHYHQRVHTGEKPHACTYCPKRFRLRTLLTIHINTHTGERPYMCEKCSKDFRSPMGLYRHQLVHTKVRRHRCTICDKTFQTSTCVKTHVKTVHFKEPMPPRVTNRKKCVEEV